MNATESSEAPKLPPGYGVMVAALLSIGFLFVGCSARSSATSGTDQKQLYTCGMHPQVIQDKPGLCPICGMKLTPVLQTSDKAADSSIHIDPLTAQNMDLRTVAVTRGPVRRSIRTVGVIDYDETALADVSTKFRGWVEKLYVDATGKQMHRGEPLFEIYSPELYLAQTEFLLTLSSPTNNAGTAAALRQQAALTKLRYWDISEDQIAELERNHQPKKTLRVNAPRDGTVVEKSVVEGQMVEAGMKLYRLADLATVWVQAQVYEQDLPFIKLGQEALVSLASQTDPKFRGRVTYLYPMVDEKTRTARVRMEFHNPGYFLKPGMYATVELNGSVGASAVLVPDMAVLRSGERNTVFVALDGGHFEAREVIIGARAEGNQYQVISGLSEGDRVVTSGQFMLDSESQLREAIQKMSQSTRVQPAQPRSEAAVSTVQTNIGADLSRVVYICPMPEHVALEYDHPGNCPLCGMALVPVSAEMLSRIQPGGQVEYYTCPMPEHSDVHESKPGKCPRCGMTLIPVMVQPKPASESNSLMPGPPAQLFTCPMSQHADVVSDKPGKCPKCEMDLVATSTVKHGKLAEDNWLHQQQEHLNPTSPMPTAPSVAH
jgi:RND family efflux transporter MFP subunit